VGKSEALLTLLRITFKIKVETMSEQHSKTRWHLLLGTLLEHLLTPLDLQVLLEVPVMSEPPKADVILRRRHTEEWTTEQKAFLPDGIRDTKAANVLLEFKYTESITTEAVQQILGYDWLYRQAQKLKPHELQCYLLSSKKPHRTTLTKFGYQATELSGVYYSKHCLIQRVSLLSLNELANTEHNVWMRCFASQPTEKKKAFQQLKVTDLRKINLQLYWFLNGLLKLYFQKRGLNEMRIELTPEDVTEVGKMWDNTLLQRLSVEQRLQGIDPEIILNHFDIAERLRGIEPEERLRGLEPEERLKGLSLKEIEAYLQKLKRTQS
jgi:hypothetical protein